MNVDRYTVIIYLKLVTYTLKKQKLRLLQNSSKIQSKNRRHGGKALFLIHDSSLSLLGIVTLLNYNRVQVVLVDPKSDVNDLSSSIKRIIVANHP